jgi:hypothetical protein
MIEARREARIINGEEVEVIVYEDGNERRADNGHWVKSAPGTEITSSERGRELVARRMMLARERAAQGMIKGLGLDPSRASASDAWERANEIFWSRFAESKNIRGMAESFEKLGRAAGFISPTEDKSHTDDGAITKSLLDFLKAKAEQARERPLGNTRESEADPVDAEVINDVSEQDPQP